ncbi:ankyrin repeat domain-containing protein [Leptospira selangorensis]|uniref:Ankyrin repeat domain-containing protein n=1 Tax=Leptospira selangorensis TaxID=2484982 RepID=A0A4R9FXU1_9LEPT|nr:ankyrin repeat domain-containing protein [Leptospira selangorensis]TGK03260.1 ankyrin repeat domain-containing protein [Leptospira selangorensis]TGM12498.1 ankyrin repeat domain-containing protein [Leptospira selangorensis]TGM16726.1 ankyrin repeat domain-containing protein [Leptospira selangorensis]
MLDWIKNWIKDRKTIQRGRELFSKIQDGDKQGFRKILDLIPNKGELKECTKGLLGFCASEIQDPFYLETLLNAGLDPNLPDRNGIFPIHKAVENGKIKPVQILLEHGADPNVADPKGVTPLHISYSYDGLAEISELLISSGADTEKRDNLGKRYLM